MLIVLIAYLGICRFFRVINYRHIYYVKFIFFQSVSFDLGKVSYFFLCKRELNSKLIKSVMWYFGSSGGEPS